MDLSAIVLLTGFLFVYGIKTCVYSVEVFYNIYCDSEDRKKEDKEEEDKNKIPESVKHLYS